MEEWKKDDLRRRGIHRPLNIGTIKPLPLYTISQKIKSAKQTNCLSLLELRSLIYHPLYHELVNGADDDHSL